MTTQSTAVLNEYPARHGAGLEGHPAGDHKGRHVAPFDSVQVLEALERSRRHIARRGTTKRPYALAIETPNRGPSRVPTPGDAGRPA